MSLSYILDSDLDRYNEAAALLASDAPDDTGGRLFRAQIQELRCHVCGTVVSAQANDSVALARHLRAAHPSEHIYVRANGQIVRSRVFLRSGLSSLHVCGDEEREYELHATWGNGSATRQRLRGLLDLTALVGPNLRGTVRIRVLLPAGAARDFTLHVQDPPPFSPQRLHGAIDALLQAVLKDRESAEITTRITELQCCPQESDPDRQYADAFIDYAWGIHAERVGRIHIAGDKLGAALRALSGFTTSRARAALCVLGVRLNAFHLLELASADWPFAAAGRFFGRAALGPSPAHDAASREAFPMAADRFTECLLRCIAALDAGSARPGQFDRVHAELRRLPAAELPDNRMKLHLLGARAAAGSGRQDDACRAYALLLEDLQFGEEARNYLRQRESAR